MVLQGDNELRAGGIRVPEGSKLILEGNGNLLIQEDYNGYFGIGNDLKSAHGTLEFEQGGKESALEPFILISVRISGNVIFT